MILSLAIEVRASSERKKIKQKLTGTKFSFPYFASASMNDDLLHRLAATSINGNWWRCTDARGLAMIPLPAKATKYAVSHVWSLLSADWPHISVHPLFEDQSEITWTLGVPPYNNDTAHVWSCSESLSRHLFWVPDEFSRSEADSSA